MACFESGISTKHSSKLSGVDQLYVYDALLTVAEEVSKRYEKDGEAAKREALIAKCEVFEKARSSIELDSEDGSTVVT
jgi:hypothetical protein